MIQTIDSEKLAKAVNTSWEKNRLETDGKMSILLQVNTSGEGEKSGVSPDKLPELYEFINEKCSALKLEGLMTIGAFGYDYSQGPNPDFVCLMECLQHLPNPESLQVSFGMSDDFENAVSRWRTSCSYRYNSLCNFRLKWDQRLYEWAARFSATDKRKIKSL